MTTGKKRILLVEENLSYARFVILTLTQIKSKPFSIEHSQKLSSAIEKFKQSDFDMVLLDPELSDSKGIDTFNAVYTAYPHIAVVLLIEPDALDWVEKAISCGAQDYLLKNSGDGRILEKTVKFIVERKRLETEVKSCEKKLADACKKNKKYEEFTDVLTKERDNAKRIFELVIRYIPVGIILVDNTGKITDVNILQSQYLGLPPEQIRGKREQISKWGILDPKTRVSPHQETMPLYNAIRNKEVTGEREYLLVRDGRERVFSISAAPVLDDYGDVIGGIGIWKDITGYKKIEHESSRFPEENPNPILRLTEKGFVLYANKASQTLLNCSTGSVVPESWHQVIADAFTRNEDRNLDFHSSGKDFSLHIVPVQKRDYINVYGRDVTDLKGAEEALRKSEGIFHAMADNISQIAWMADSKGWVFCFNKRYFDYTGTTLEEVQGWGWQKVHHPEHVGRVKERMNRSLQKGIFLEDTYPLRGRNGVYRWFLTRIVPVKNHAGKVIRWLGTGTDITDIRILQQKLENALMEAQNQRAETEAVLNSFPDGYVIYNKDGSIAKMNAVAQEVFGISTDMERIPYEQQLRNIHLLTLEGKPYDTDKLPSRRALNGEIVRDLIMRIPGKEKDLWISVSSSPIVIGDQISGAIIEFTDITRLHNLQIQYRDEKNFIDTILQTSSALIIVTDPSHRIVRFNRTCENLTGYTENDALGSSFLEFIPFDEQDKVKQVLINLSSEKSENEYESQVVSKDGQKRFIHWRHSVMYDEQGKVAFLVGTGIDITERKSMERELISRAAELTSLNRDLESFSYSISHDLRGPLSIIKGFVDILREDYSQRIDEDGRDYLERISGTVDGMQQLIDSLLVLSRVERQELKRERINISEIVDNYLLELIKSEPGRKVELEIEKNVHVFADSRLIRVALENLLRNAWKFTSKNEVSRIEFGTVISEGKRNFYIRDNGVGFSMQYARLIFEPFRRVHSQRDFGGTGIGLSIVFRVIRRHGGKIRAEGEVNKGAAFYFTLD